MSQYYYKNKFDPAEPLKRDPQKSVNHISRIDVLGLRFCQVCSVELRHGSKRYHSYRVGPWTLARRVLYFLPIYLLLEDTICVCQHIYLKYDNGMLHSQKEQFMMLKQHFRSEQLQLGMLDSNEDRSSGRAAITHEAY